MPRSEITRNHRKKVSDRLKPRNLLYLNIFLCFFFRNIKPKSKSKRKIPPKLAFVSEPVASELDFELDGDTQHDFDFDPVLETKTELNEDLESKPEAATPPVKTVVKKETPVIKQKSGYQRKRTFECYQCSLECSKLYELKAHITVFHPFEEPKKDVLNCPYCTKTTISRKVLSCHLRKVNNILIMHTFINFCVSFNTITVLSILFFSVMQH